MTKRQEKRRAELARYCDRATEKLISAGIVAVDATAAIEEILENQRRRPEKQS